MQNRYIGDVGDFGKFALLRALCQSSKLRLGVIWCLYPDENHNSDGRHIGYLRRPTIRKLDPQLFDELGFLVNRNRSLDAVQEAGILPLGTTFFEAPTIGLSGEGRIGARRMNYRLAWLESALKKSSGSEMVFLDPDNGIEVKSVAKDHLKAGKYIYWEELDAFWRAGKSLVVYQHLNRLAPAIKQTEQLRKNFRRQLGNPPLLMPLLFRRGSCRHFWLIAQRQHAAKLEHAARQFLASGWNAHFQLC
jgi:hypothetical protein